MSRQFTRDFFLEVAKKKIVGTSFIDKFGENPSITSAEGFADIWDAGGVYVPPTQARLHDVASDNAFDAGTLVSSGTATGGSITSLVDTGATFISDGVVVGDFVLNDENCELGNVTAVTSETTLAIAGSMRSPDDGLNGDPNESGDVYRVVSDASTGASFVFFKGLDANRISQDEFIILDGVNTVVTTNSYLRQYRARAFATASAGAIGTVTSTAQTDGTITCQIIDGNNQTLMAIYTVPFGKTGYVDNWWGSLSKKQGAISNMRLRAGILDGVGYVLQSRSIDNTGNSSFSHSFNVPLLLPGGADIWVEADSDNAGGVGIGSGFTITLIDD